MPDLFGQQEEHTAGKDQPGAGMAVMFVKSMPERPAADKKSQPDHAILKGSIMDDIHPQDREAGDGQRQNGAMDRAKDGGGNAQGIPVDRTFYR